MPATTTIRELRNNFPRVRKLVEAEGEVLVTEQGTPKYRLTPYRRPRNTAAPPKDYVSRLRRHQPKPLSIDEVSALHDANRGTR
jgi:prevent-host-death family protein